IPVEKLDSLIISRIKTENKAILIDTLKQYICSIEKNLLNEDIQNIKTAIAEKENSVSNLIKQLSKSKSESLSDRLMEELNDLYTQIEELKNNLKLIHKKKSIAVNKNNNIPYIMYSLSDFGRTINLIDDITKKRFLIQSVVESASWDCDNNNVEVRLSFTSDKQFDDVCKPMDCNLYSGKK
ncbi:MAG: hypothetical protein ACI398_06810, partial [Clostridium sp.]